MAHNDIIEGKAFQMPDELTVVAIGGGAERSSYQTFMTMNGS